MDDTNDFKSDSPPLSDLLRIDTICDRFELDLRAGKQPTPEDFLGEVPEAVRPALLEQLRAIVSETDEDGENGIERGSQIGRYRIERILGAGGFGRVYLAHDDQLQRLVAIKVPHRKLVDRHENAEAYLTEARTVANLDHPNIVPVFDVGSTEGCPCYVVSKHIDGTDLASRLKQSRLSIHEAVELVVTVAGALHHAHKQGLVHRDIKPGNILLDKSGKPFVADFGLALREQDVGKGPRYAGTPAYMSPEQALGEGHRVDGRSDIFSLGVVFYKLLVGSEPFRGSSQSELMEQITSLEPRPPRQIDDTIPKELERICLKALSKRASERYMTAKDMADDLGHFAGTSQALAVPAGALLRLLGEDDGSSAKRKRRWFQFRLRSLMIVVTVLSVAWAYVAHENKIAYELAQSKEKLWRIGSAMFNYRSQFSTFPAAYIASKDGKPLLSWRVKILPYLEEEKLYKDFHLDEPWDSEHNKALISRMPNIFAVPGSKAAEEFKTNYLVPRGDDTIFTGAKQTRIVDITDGASQTALVVEANDDRAEIWTKPDDFKIDPIQPKEGLVGLRGGEILAAFITHRCVEVKVTAEPDTIKALLILLNSDP